ncbi:B3/B4 domain-containing protein [Micromonospora okii]|uniref:B3/B4 domain-containing protein n=1 Tax=Micromonospora okii TaxID=1182970 RepID=UPI001E482D1A|nr:phenylalanine--tRNA ligase beta subunit-related protein [Micromonospora okii]
MYLQHSARLRAEHPTLVAGVLHAEGVGGEPRDDLRLAEWHHAAREHLAAGSEAGLPQIQAWRRAFGRMGLAPTRYRCAAESLLRRMRTVGDLPAVSALVDLCNALSVAYAIPVGVFDTARVAKGLEVRHALGTESYLTFGGEEEHPDPDEVVFVDEEGRAHARRWTNRQSGWSAVGADTDRVLVVAEALHPGAEAEVPKLLADLAEALRQGWEVAPRTAVLTATRPRFEV